MELKEALEILAAGHSILVPDAAEEVCRVIGVPFDRDRLVRRYSSDPPGTHKGLTMARGMEGSEGVHSLILSGYVAEALGVLDQAQERFGRGSQAREYARVVAEKLKRKEE